MKTCKVSIIIPAFNAQRTLKTAVISALEQSHADLEVIVVNDASSDETHNVVQSIHDSRLKLITSNMNYGPGLSRDRAIRTATGEWISFLDADDAFTPDRIYRLLQAATTTDADIVFDDIMLCHDTPSGFEPWQPLHKNTAFGEHEDKARLISTESYIRSKRLLVKPMIKTQFIRQNSIRHSAKRFAEDAEFILRLTHSGARLCYTPSPMYLYRITPGSLTAQMQDPALMRNVIEECSQWPGWPSVTQDAFIEKIAALSTKERLYALQSALQKKQLITAFKLMINSPCLIFLGIKYLPQRFSYLYHRLRHNGRKR